MLVAALGLYFVYLAIADLVEAVLAALHLYDIPRSAVGAERYWAVRAVLQFVIGFLLMARVIPLENVAFPESSDGPSENEPP